MKGVEVLVCTKQLPSLKVQLEFGQYYILEGYGQGTYHFGRAGLVDDAVAALLAADRLLGPDLDLGGAGAADVLRDSLRLLRVGRAARVTAHKERVTSGEMEEVRGRWCGKFAGWLAQKITLLLEPCSACSARIPPHGQARAKILGLEKTESHHPLVRHVLPRWPWWLWRAWRSWRFPWRPRWRSSLQRRSSRHSPRDGQLRACRRGRDAVRLD